MPALSCPTCRMLLGIPEGAGGVFRCPRCQGRLVVPIPVSGARPMAEPAILKARRPPRWQQTVDRCVGALAPKPVIGRLFRTRRRAVFTLAVPCLLVGLFWASVANEVMGLDSGPAFDADSFERTCRWAHEEAKKVDQYRHNEIGVGKAQQAFHEQLAKLAGRRVRWQLQLLEVRAEGEEAVVRAYTPSLPYSDTERLRQIDQALATGSAPGVGVLNVSVSVAGPSGQGFRVPAEAAASLRHGTRFTVEGTVLRTGFRYDPSGNFPSAAVTFILKDFRIR